MKKIVDLTESDLKRIVKKVLNERQILNELEPFTIGLLIVGGAALIGGSVAGFTWFNGSDAATAVEKLFNSCKSGMEGKPLQTNSQHRAIATRINDSIEGLFTDEDELSSALASIKSVPDLCLVIKEYEISGFGNMYKEIDGDIDGNEWEKYVRIPLSNAVRYTEKANENVQSSDGDKTKSDDKVSTGGSNKGTSSGEGTVRDLQQLLKDKGYNVGSYGVDGKFGSDTLEATLKALRDSLK
jgi:hypothetical protein